MYIFISEIISLSPEEERGVPVEAGGGPWRGGLCLV